MILLASFFFFLNFNFGFRKSISRLMFEYFRLLKRERERDEVEIIIKLVCGQRPYVSLFVVLAGCPIEF